METPIPTIPASTSIATNAPSYASLLTLQELVARLASHVHAAHDEIGETRAILRDAIERLMPAFTDTNGTSTAPANIGITTSPTHDAAFNALQFQDISDQLLAHAQCRLSALVRELDRIAKNVEPADLIRQDALMLHLLTHVEQVNDNLAELDLSLSKPVSKAHLGVGEMELF